MATKKLGAGEKKELLALLKERFEANQKRHKGVAWETVEAKLKASEAKLWSLSEMEKTGGEPDVVAIDKKTGDIIFVDCAPESPEGRRSLCFDKAALLSRKANAPEGDAVSMALAMGTELLDTEMYKVLQKLGDFDTKTSSWLATPESVRALGGALFGDCRYDAVFVYHNGADSYYAARGFRVMLRV